MDADKRLDCTNNSSSNGKNHRVKKEGKAIVWNRLKKRRGTYRSIGELGKTYGNMGR